TDAGRIFTPYVDSIQGLVLFEQVQADGSHTLTAYDTGNGSPRWRIPLAGVTAATPKVIQVSNETLSLFSAQTATQTALRNWSWTRLLLLAISIASLFTLLLLWILPFQLWVKKLKHALSRDRKSTRLNSSHRTISYAVFCLKKKKKQMLTCLALLRDYHL